MTLNVVRLEDAAPQAWRNGGGVTRELLTWPNADDWIVRLSVADIEKDGPFSAFPGDRKSTRLNSSHGKLSRMPSSA